jgi:uncharacterized protein YdeI (YjbR/CyaY-like superfamily)
MSEKIEFDVIAFASAKEWERWLAKNHAKTDGVWIQFSKKGSNVRSVSYDEALIAALCYGWIDGQIKGQDQRSYIHKFTPRRAKSIWSRRNCELVERLIAEEKMKPAGLNAIKAAKADGRWERAYDSPGKMTLPDDFVKAVSKNKKAATFLAALSRANLYAIAWRLQTAKKPETRTKRMKAIVEMLTKGQKFH